MSESSIADSASETRQARFAGWRTHLGAVALAMVAVAVLYWLADKTGDSLVTKPEVGPGEAERLPLLSALFATAFLGGVVAPGAAFLARRFSSDPHRVFGLFSFVGLVLYGLLAFVRADSTITALWFNAMHVVAAGPILGSLLHKLSARKPENIP